MNIDPNIIEDIYHAISYIRWDRLFKDKPVDYIFDYIVNNKDKYFAYFYSSRFKYKKDEIENLILKLNDSRFLYLYYKNIDCDKDKFLQKILKNKSVKYIFKLGNLNTKYFNEVKKILFSQNTKKPYYAAKLLNIYPKNKKLINYILKSRKPKYLLNLVKICKSKNVFNKIKNILIEDKNVKWLIKLFSIGSKIFKLNIKKFDRIIMCLGTIDEIIYYIDKFKRRNLDYVRLLS